MKKIIALLPMLAIVFTAVAKQEDPRQIVLSVDRADGQYKAGETVEVSAVSDNDFEDGTLALEVYVNGKRKVKDSPLVLKASNPTVIFSGSYEKPSSVIVRVKTPGEKKAISQVGFVVEPEGFKPGFEDPADFREFWDKQLKTMRKSKMKPVLTPYALEGDKFAKYADKCECFAFEINMPEGRPARGFIALPKDAEKNSLPIIMSFHGAGYSISNVNAAVNMACKFNAITIDMNAHGYEDVKEIAEQLGETELKDYRRRPVTDHQNFYFRLMYLRDVRALDYATKRPEWDGKRILVRGSSQGGGQSLAVAAIDPRVTAVYAEVPALTDMGGNFSDHSGGWPGYSKSMIKGDNLENEKAVLPYYDGATFARHITSAKVWMEAGLIDTTCPPECVISAFNSLATSDKRLYTFPYRQHTTRRFDARENKLWKETIDSGRQAEIREYLR